MQKLIFYSVLMLVCWMLGQTQVSAIVVICAVAALMGAIV